MIGIVADVLVILLVVSLASGHREQLQLYRTGLISALRKTALTITLIHFARVLS